MKKDHIVIRPSHSTNYFVIFLNVLEDKLKFLVMIYVKMFPMS